jgi:hypothetical protein
MPNYPFNGILNFIQAYVVPRIEPGRYKWFVREPEKLQLDVRASGTTGKLLPTTNDLAFQDGDIVTVQGFLGYLSCKRDSHIIHLTLGIKEDSPNELYDIESLMLLLVPAQKRQSKKGTLAKSI